jgi:hypothetical protein
MASDPRVTIEGQTDTSGALVIDPADDPQTAQLGTLLVIDRMPVTKTITTATFGDLSTGSCSQDTTMNIQLNDRTTNQGVAASDRAQITDQLGRVTWHFDPAVTLLKGHRYAFETGSVLGCGWWQVQQRTWAGPLDPQTGQVEPPEYNAGCLHAEGVGGSNLYGMWHVEGENDAVNCDPSPYDGVPANFSPDMPTGWLVVDQVNWIPRVASPGERWSTPPPDSNCPGPGQTSAWWRPSPDPPTGLGDYVCLWPQFMPSGQTSGRAFAWSTPWSSTGQPRVGYVKLDTIDYDALLRQYSPVLQYDSQEPYYAMAADTAVSNTTAPGCEDGAGFAMTNYLRRASDHVALAAVDPACGPRLSMDWLVGEGKPYPGASGTTASDGDFIDEAPNYGPDAASLYLQSGGADHIYGRAFEDANGALWLQYWMYYYYNDGEAPGDGFDHEGDWENIQIKLSSATGAPVSATYAQHNKAETCAWPDVERLTGDHPNVFVAMGRHASYFHPGEYQQPDFNPLYPDVANGDGPRISSMIDVVTATSPDWIRWPGKWGASGEGGLSPEPSPAGPARHGQWNDPTVLEDKNVGCRPSDGVPSLAGSSQSNQVGRSTQPAAIPKLLPTTIADGVRVDYSVPASAGSGLLVVTLTSTQKRVPPTARHVTVSDVRSGSLTLERPPAPGPYVVRASVVGKHGRTSLTEVAVK